MKRLLPIAIIMIIIFCPLKTAKGILIEDVHTDPIEPKDVDIITIVVSGIGGTPTWIDDSDFRIEDTSLELDIFLRFGPYGAISPWSHSEIIGTLPANYYDLAVSAYVYNDLTEIYEFRETYSTGFTVVPEPATLLLLTMGAVWIRAGKRRT